MKKQTYKQMSGILTLILLVGASTWFIQDTGSKGRCSNGWQYVESGEYEGYYSCQTATSTRYEMCFEVYNSSNTENYWCKKGKLIKKEVKETIKSSGKRYVCNPNGCEAIN